MRFSTIIATISPLVLAALAASCSSEGGPLPPPSPPPSPPAEVEMPPEGEAAPARQEVARPPGGTRRQVTPPNFVVIMLRLKENKRELDTEKTVHLVNLLLGNRFSARKAVKLPAELPEGIIEAAQETATAQPGAGSPEVFIFGQIKPGIPADVRLVAVDMRNGKHIDNYGNQGPPSVMDEIIRRTLASLLESVETYWVKGKG